jgi:UPF0176 protein
MKLYNTLPKEELAALVAAETEPRITVSFYSYHSIPEPQSFRDEMFAALTQMRVLGRIFVATEGINAQCSVPQSHFEELKNYLYQFPPMNGLRLNTAADESGTSFLKLKIKVRPKIVADGIGDQNFDVHNNGKYLNAQEFNAFTENPETIVIDMRNHYEYEVGHFKNAIEIPSDTFREQLPMALDMLKGKEDKPVVMYCTGGIRCEKASAYFRYKGFKDVYHLEGGIIHYVNNVRQKGLENKFIGKNFVFDDRLGERITEDIIAHCHICGTPCDTHTNCKNDGCHLLFIQCATCSEKYMGCCSEACHATVQLPEDVQKELRKGIDKGQMVHGKSLKRKRTKSDREGH